MPETTFQELAYKERKVFAEINRLRDVTFKRLSSDVYKELDRVDFGQQKTTHEAAVKFNPSKSLRFSSPRGKLGAIGAGKGKGMFGKPIGAGKKDTGGSVSDGLLKGSKSMLSSGATWTTEGYQETRPTVAEAKGILTPLPPVPRQKLPRLLANRGRITKRPI